MKITANRLLEEIAHLGGGEILEYKLLRRLDISHGQFCQLRKVLVAAGRLEVTHPNRKARYRVLETSEGSENDKIFCPDVELVKCSKCPKCDKCSRCAKRATCAR